MRHHPTWRIDYNPLPIEQQYFRALATKPVLVDALLGLQWPEPPATVQQYLQTVGLTAYTVTAPDRNGGIQGLVFFAFIDK
jgi:hypothetical protein